MKVETAQEILGSFAVGKDKDAIVAYYLENKYIPENDADKIALAEEGGLDTTGNLLIGVYVLKTESNQGVLKFKPVANIPVYDKDQAKQVWKGKLRTIPVKK